MHCLLHTHAHTNVNNLDGMLDAEAGVRNMRGLIRVVHHLLFLHHHWLTSVVL